MTPPRSTARSTAASRPARQPAPHLTPVADDVHWVTFGRQWTRSLRARNTADSTIRTYQASLKHLAEWAIPRGFESPEDLTDADLEDYFGWALRRTTRYGRQAKPAAVAKDYRQLRVFFNWLARIDDPKGISVMTGLTAPTVPEQPVDILSDDQLRDLLRACAGPGFTERRDTAIIRLLLDTGMRRAELIGISIADVDLDEQLAEVLGKGGRRRKVPYGAKTAEALDAYLRARARHKDRRRPELWLAGHPHRGALGYDGLSQMLGRRSAAAGVPNVFPHRFRHTAASAFLEAGGSEGDAMQIFGWQTRTMVDRYGKSAAHRRAIQTARKLSIGDRV